MNPKKAAAAYREKLAKSGKGGCPYGTNVPQRGEWTPENSRGHGEWTLPGGHVVPYENGYPQFDRAYKMENGEKIPAVHPDGKVEIPYMKGTDADSGAATEAMREKLGKPEWVKPDRYIWHHMEDGTGMQLVRSDFHHGHEGANHLGGAAIAKSPEF